MFNLISQVTICGKGILFRTKCNVPRLVICILQKLSSRALGTFKQCLNVVKTKININIFRVTTLLVLIYLLGCVNAIMFKHCYVHTLVVLSLKKITFPNIFNEIK